MAKTSPIDPKIAMVEDLQIDPTTKLHKDIRIFGGSFIVIFSIISGLALWRAPESWLTWLWIPGLAIGIPALVYPPVMKPFYRVWMLLASILGWIISRILFTTFYYSTITPVALFMKLIRRDYLNLKFPRDGESNWSKVPDSANDPKHLEHMF